MKKGSSPPNKLNFPYVVQAEVKDIGADELCPLPLRKSKFFCVDSASINQNFRGSYALGAPDEESIENKGMTFALNISKENRRNRLPHRGNRLCLTSFPSPVKRKGTLIKF